MSHGDNFLGHPGRGLETLVLRRLMLEIVDLGTFVMLVISCSVCRWPSHRLNTFEWVFDDHS